MNRWSGCAGCEPNDLRDNHGRQWTLTPRRVCISIARPNKSKPIVRMRYGAPARRGMVTRFRRRRHGERERREEERPMSKEHRLADGSGDKAAQLEPFRESPDGTVLTTDQGVPIRHTDDSLKGGPRGPTLLEDFHFREKLTHFDHERVPERIVHARGSAAHGYFEAYEDLSDITRAKLFSKKGKRTAVFVRFSTVVGFRGSADTVRDVRGFATKFYTEEGNWDLVGNNMPIFFIQDGIKFPDLVHAIKPEPHNEMPQASAAHDNFWDFISLTPESMAMIMWVLSDRALPRSYARMEGFGVHTFRFVNARGEGRFVKFHWKPIAGLASLVWDETQKIAGKDPDFNRRDLWERIENGHSPEFELGLQIVEEKDEHAFGFDLLDATKIIPEEVVPVRRIGRMVLDRNPDNFFAEAEQAAFHPGHVVPGIDFTNDPLLQARLFSYLDTQLIRLGGPNFAEIPINRPVAPVHNNQRDGYHRQTINSGRTNYFPNSMGGGCPALASQGYVHYQERVDGNKVRERSKSFSDHYGQATLFWNSLTAREQERLVDAAHFELGKVETLAIRKKMVEHFARVDHAFGVRVARKLGLPEPNATTKNHGQRSAALSVERNTVPNVKAAKVAILLTDGFDADHVAMIEKALKGAGAEVKLVAKAGTVKSANGQEREVDKMLVTTSSVLFDAVFVPGGLACAAALATEGAAVHFLREAFKHGKPVAALGNSVELLVPLEAAGAKIAAPGASDLRAEGGVVTQRAAPSGSAFSDSFVAAIAEHRHWDRDVDKIAS
jgi:catalase